MLAPKRIKFRKTFKGRTKGVATRGNTVAFGEWGVMSLEPGWITNRQIEAARVAMTREMKRGGKVWIRIFPDKPITKKPAETRMGKGKGNPEGWVAVIKPGRMLFEVDGVPVEKRSTHKQSHGGRKAARRLSRPTGTIVEEVIYPAGQPPADDGPSRELAVPMVRGGAVLVEPDLAAARRRVADGLHSLLWEGLALSQGDPAIPTRQVPPRERRR